MTTTLERPRGRSLGDVSTTGLASSDEAASLGSRGRTADRVLLVAGIVAVAVYGLGDLVTGLMYEGYSWRDQAISELSAFGSPVRPWMVAAILIHGSLLVAFGVGVWRSARRTSSRWIGGFLVAAGLIGFPTHTFFAMSSRGMETGFNDTMHIILTGVFSLFLMAAMTICAIAYRGWMRLYSIATLIVLIGFGAASGNAMGGLEDNFTPWAGGFERINAYAYFAWLVVLAVLTLRSRNDPRNMPGRSTSGDVATG